MKWHCDRLVTKVRMVRTIGLGVLLVLALVLAHGASAAATTVIEAEKFSLPTSAGKVFTETGASDGKALLIWGNASATTTVQTATLSAIGVRVRANQCQGAPRLSLKVDDQTVATKTVYDSWWKTHVFPVKIAAGQHRLTVSYDNDFYQSASCDRNLRVDSLSLQPATPVITATPTVKPSATPTATPQLTPTPSPQPTTTPAPAIGNPLAGLAWYWAADSPAQRMVTQWQTMRPAEAAQLQKVASQPTAQWLGGWSGDIATNIKTRLSTAQAAGGTPVFVAYNIPQRDCGGYSAGGVGSPEAYRSWISQLASALGSHPAVVILEPDALAMLDCLSAGDRQTRLDLLRHAVTVLRSRPQTFVYLDAGHSAWHAPEVMAERLRGAGVAHAHGFSTNVSNYRTTASETAYAQALSTRLNGAHAVIDTSRNGLGALASQWCNPAGRALGEKPTTATANPIVDAYLWIKVPGESDGTCNGGPNAGTFWPEYALGLAQRAAW